MNMKNYIIAGLSVAVILLGGYVFIPTTPSVDNVKISDAVLFNEKFSSERWDFEYTYPDGYVGQIDLEDDGQKRLAIKRRINNPTYEESFLNEGNGGDDYAEGICINCSMTIEVLTNFLRSDIETPEEWFAFQGTLDDESEYPISSSTTVAGQLTRVDVFESDTWYTLFKMNDGGGYDKYMIKIKNDSPDKEALLNGFSFR